MNRDDIIRTLDARAAGALPDQRSTTDQLRDLRDVAVFLGMYDAADVLDLRLEAIEREGNYQVVRSLALRRQAEAVCERRTAERDEALARVRALEREAAYGRALLELQRQARRLRATHCPTMGFDWCARGVARALLDEVEELTDEPIGSDEARAETRDVLTTALQLLDVHGEPLLDGMMAAADKLGRRLDHVESGGTWAEAKAMEAD